MTKRIMIQGTCSNAGKSLIAAGLCRIFRQDGYRVAPFKAQNMALNSYITADGLEMGRAQVMQAEAAGIAPDVRMNPILLKPTSDEGSQVIINGEVEGNYTARDFYREKPRFKADVKKAFDSLAEDYDIIVIEGAGSPAEINLKDDDLVNMGMAKMADAPVLLTGDIDRGGVFASLAGTMLLFTEEEKARVKGVIINKFRGDVDILKPGLDMLEDIIHVPVAGVVPYLHVDVDDEDSLTERFSARNTPGLIDIAVIRVPKISNFTDFNALEYIDGVTVRYVGAPGQLGDPDMIILPGTKSTMADLKWLRESGLEAEVLKFASRGKPVFGICGGYQMLGQSLSDPEGVEGGGSMRGMGLLPHGTVFAREKTRTAEEGILSDVTGIFAGLSKAHYKGYEIHMGLSEASGNIINAGNVYGTYIHGIFDSEEIASAVIKALYEAKGLDSSQVKAFDMDEYKEKQYDIEETDVDVDPRYAHIIKRCIHTSADFDYARTMFFSEGVEEKIASVIKSGGYIVTDTKMALSGINKKRIEAYGGKVLCFIGDEDVAAAAKDRGLTRSYVSMEKAADLDKPAVFAIGNAPTALIAICELFEAGRLYRPHRNMRALRGGKA